ncbi:MAG: hypothetical protein ACM37W_27335 [Actinomycetota bacterium]
MLLILSISILWFKLTQKLNCLRHLPIHLAYCQHGVGEVRTATDEVREELESRRKPQVWEDRYLSVKTATICRPL